MGVPETKPVTRTGRFLHIRQKLEPAEIHPMVPDSLKIIFIHKTTNQQLIKNN